MTTAWKPLATRLGSALSAYSCACLLARILACGRIENETPGHGSRLLERLKDRFGFQLPWVLEGLLSPVFKTGSKLVMMQIRDI